jgi:hypothetical protein
MGNFQDIDMDLDIDTDTDTDSDTDPDSYTDKHRDREKQDFNEIILKKIEWYEKGLFEFAKSEILAKMFVFA